MNNYQAFVAGFWSGLAAPTAIYAKTPMHRPAICSLTFADSFALVGQILSNAMREGHVEFGEGESTDGPAPADGQLSFDFANS